MFIYILSIAVLWGFGQILVKKGYKKLTPWQTYAVDAYLNALPI